MTEILIHIGSPFGRLRGNKTLCGAEPGMVTMRFGGTWGRRHATCPECIVADLLIEACHGEHDAERAFLAAGDAYDAHLRALTASADRDAWAVEASAILARREEASRAHSAAQEGQMRVRRIARALRARR